MKDQQHQFALIDNTYSGEQAREVITSLINDKIRFLNMQMLSIHERTGGTTTHLENRVKELEADKRRLITLFAECTENKADIEISCEVKLVTKQPASVHA